MSTNTGEPVVAEQGAGAAVYSALPATELKRVLKTRDLVIFGMVFMAPVSAQTLFGNLTVVSQGHGVLAYLLGLIAMLFTAYSYGQMAKSYPRAGSTYSYTSQAIHPYVGFMAGWSILLDYVMIPVLLYKISAIFLMEVIPLPLWAMLLVFVVPVTIFNILGAKTSARVNMFMTAAMLLSIVLFVIFAAIFLVKEGGIGSLFQLKGIYNPDTFSMGALVAAANIAVLSYLGFDSVTTMAEDSRVTGRMVGTAAILACVINACFYMAQVYFGTLVTPDINGFESVDTAFFELAVLVGGGGLATFLTLIIAISGISTALAGQASASRLLFGMGRDGVLPKFYARLHPKFKTPIYSILFMAVVGYLIALWVDLDALFMVIVFGALIGFMGVNASTFAEYFVRRKMRSGIDWIRYVLFPLIGLAVCIYIFSGMAPIGKIVGGIWFVIGLIFLAVASRGFTKKGELFSKENF